jgi:hypothetical protein
MYLIVVACVLCGELVAGCMAGEHGVSMTADARSIGIVSAAGPSQALSGQTDVIDSGMQSIIRAALADAARRTGYDPSALQVIGAETVNWPDGSLGCPEPGMNYTLALVPGYRIRIQAGTEVLDYHASRRGSLVLCPAGRSVDPVPGGPT